MAAKRLEYGLCNYLPNTKYKKNKKTKWKKKAKKYYICILKFVLHMIRLLGNSRVIHDKTILQSICSAERYVNYTN